MNGTVFGFSLNRVNLMPDSIAEEVMQNVAVILSTQQGSVPLYRDFGLNRTFLDMPANIAETVLAAAIYEAVEKYEPRAKIVSISFEDDMNTPGKLIPTVEVEITDG